MATIVTRPATDEYRDNWEATFGKKLVKCDLDDKCPGHESSTDRPCNYTKSAGDE